MGQSISSSDDECVITPTVGAQTKRGEETALGMKTLDCNWLKSENQEAHRTDEYENDLLVLRRGQSFKLKVQFQRAFNKDFDKTSLEFSTGSNPQLLNNTKIRCPLVDELEKDKWGMKIVNEVDALVTFEVNIPTKTLIGKYKVSIEFETQMENGNVVKSSDPEPDIYILFNPWSTDDAVYMEDEKERAEYCLNDTGIIYRGSTRSIYPKRWNFGQFEKNILECSLSLLDKDKRMLKNPAKWIGKRSDPVWVSRVVSLAVNDHVLRGNWSGKYEGGTSPTKWNGSVKILTEHYNTNKIVNYGQCWVFSGVVTTVLRCLGIPTRSITNFASAHDTEGSMTIDSYINESGNEVSLSNDSVWNFHVWNEAWMARPDLPVGYGGWQVVDATPQEISLGLYQTGPAPLKAIKNGEIYLGFETGFVFAEVNSDKITWIVEKQGGSYVVTRKGAHYKRSVGRNISTKQVGVDARNDVTLDYKFAEGSEEEREAFRKAYSFGSTPDYHKGLLVTEEEGKGLTINFSSPEVIYNGENIDTKVTLKNDSDDDVTLTVNAVMYSTNYTGEKSRFIKRMRYTDVQLGGNQTIEQSFNVLFNEYHGKLSDQQSVRLTVAAKVNETNKIFTDYHQLELENRDTISIDLESSELKVGNTYKIRVKFSNPLSVDMDGIEMTVEGAGLSYPVNKEISGSLAPSETLEEVFEITPTKRGRRILLIDVDSKQVKDMKKSMEIIVVRG